jgi:hypothetical protein
LSHFAPPLLLRLLTAPHAPSAAALAVQVLAGLLLDAPAKPDIAALGEHAVGAYQAMMQVCIAASFAECAHLHLHQV